MGDPELLRMLFRKPGERSEARTSPPSPAGRTRTEPRVHPRVMRKSVPKGTLRPSLLCYERTEENGQGETPVPEEIRVRREGKQK